MRRLIGVVWLLIALLLGTLAWTAQAVGQRVGGDGVAVDPAAHPANVGVAIARSCAESGPVSRLGIGYWFSCDADVRWGGNSGGGTVTFANSELTPDDVGKPVQVARSARGSAAVGNENHFRNVNRPYEWLGWTVFALLGIAAVGFLGNGVLRLAPRDSGTQRSPRDPEPG